MTIDPKTQSFIDARIKDIQESTHRPKSYIINELILKSLLPENDTAQDLIKHRLYAPEGSIKATIKQLFFNNSYNGEHGYSEYDNFYPIIQFCLRDEKLNNAINLKEVKFDIDKFNGYATIINQTIENYKEKHKKYYVAHDFTIGKKEKIIFPFAVFSWINDYWDALGNKSVTYDYLNMIVDCIEFTETYYKRDTLYTIICSISEDWS